MWAAALGVQGGRNPGGELLAPLLHPSSLGASLCLCILVLQGGKSQREPANINPASREANELLSGLTAHKKGAAKGPQPQGEGLAAEGPCTGATVPCAPMLEAARCQTLHTQSFHTKKKRAFAVPFGAGWGLYSSGAALHCFFWFLVLLSLC